MERFVPYGKLSKKKKRELDAKKRGTWAISPVTRVPPNPRAYNRNKARKWSGDGSPSVPFLCAVTWSWKQHGDRTRCFLS